METSTSHPHGAQAPPTASIPPPPPPPAPPRSPGRFRSAARRLSPFGLLALAGGGLAVAGAAMSWMTLQSRHQTGVAVRGLSLTGGRVAFGAGIALALTGLAIWAFGRSGARRWIAALAVAAGALIVGTAVASTQNTTTGLRGAMVRAGGRQRPAASAGTNRPARRTRGGGAPRGRSLDLGLYLAIGGGTLGLVGGAGGLAGEPGGPAPADAPEGPEASRRGTLGAEVTRAA